MRGATSHSVVAGPSTEGGKWLWESLLSWAGSDLAGPAVVLWLLWFCPLEEVSIPPENLWFCVSRASFSCPEESDFGSFPLVSFPCGEIPFSSPCCGCHSGSPGCGKGGDGALPRQFCAARALAGEGAAAGAARSSGHGLAGVLSPSGCPGGFWGQAPPELRPSAPLMTQGWLAVSSVVSSQLIALPTPSQNHGILSSLCVQGWLLQQPLHPGTGRCPSRGSSSPLAAEGLEKLTTGSVCPAVPGTGGSGER